MTPTAATAPTAPTAPSVDGVTNAAVARARTGGPDDDVPKIVEHIMGWVLVVVLAMLVTQAGLL
ncbi:SCO1431 family membrane protein [Streptomyces tirandamycinicus]|uniref:SCO1431 family membrane protein n=1 Tax=Streptomyces tirandamycinicus TaxID=2174846 RepID=UPI00226E939E|nr:SCO1431 family membrane protein [Streptomyces tirandamycinicus]MCY0983351.1 SCO1431 family membrane protein [Streptomyces tirandamycinicus]